MSTHNIWDFFEKYERYQHFSDEKSALSVAMQQLVQSRRLFYHLTTSYIRGLLMMVYLVIILG